MRIEKKRTKYHKYIFDFTYDPVVVSQLREVRSNLQDWKDLTFDGETKSWCFTPYYVYERLCELFDPEVDPKVEKEMEEALEAEREREEQEERLNNLSNQKLKEVEVPTRTELFPFQKKAVDFCDKANGKALIADEMGLGKTIEAIGYAVYKKCSRVLVIAPASVKENWRREIEKFSGVKAKIIHNSFEPKELKGEGWEILGYPSIAKFWDYLRKEDYDLIIIDEAHYIKNKKAIRTKKTLRLLKKAKDVLFLTGTPVLNRPIEVYNIYNFIRPTDFWEFVHRYCGAQKAKFGWDFNGATNLQELKEKMSFMIMRKKKEVLTELPDKTINVINTELTDWADYNEALTDFKTWLTSNNLSQKALYAEAITKANYLKQIVAKQKLKEIKKTIDNFLLTGKKLIIFSQYKFIIDELHAQYNNSVVLTGASSEIERQKAIDSFQQDETTRLFFSTLKAGGVGITLTAADTVLFTDLDWTPATHQQAEDRAYRIGQKNNVNIYYFITPETIEEKIWAMLKRKERMVNKIMEGADKVRKVHIKTLLKNL